MEITLENKAKFFAQYMHQVVFGFGCPEQNGDPDDGSLYVLNGTTLEQDIETSYISLKPLSSITDEHTIECVKLYKDNVRGDINLVEIQELIRASYELKERILLNYWNGINNGERVLFVFDYLRSKGYALPWMGLSVEEMVQTGWIKLTTP